MVCANLCLILGLFPIGDYFAVLAFNLLYVFLHTRRAYPSCAISPSRHSGRGERAPAETLLGIAAAEPTRRGRLSGVGPSGSAAPRPPFLAGTAGIVAGGARASSVTYFWTRPRGNRRERPDELTCSRGLTKRRPLVHRRPRRHLLRTHRPRHGKGGLLVAVVGTDAG